MGFPVHTINILNGSSNVRQDRLFLGMLANIPTPPSANAVTALGAITPGSGFTSINTVSLAPVGGTGSGLSALATSLKAVSATLANAGSGYAANDTINLGNGVVVTVNTVNAGAIATFTVTSGGSVANAPANPVAQASTSGSGTGAKFNLSWGLGSAAITNSGNYTAAPTGLTVTDTAGGTGASIAAPTLGGNGNAVSVFVPFELPSSYAVQVTPGMPCSEFVPANLKTPTGFTASFTPATTLAAGSFDAVVLA